MELIDFDKLVSLMPDDFKLIVPIKFAQNLFDYDSITPYIKERRIIKSGDVFTYKGIKCICE